MADDPNRSPALNAPLRTRDQVKADIVRDVRARRMSRERALRHLQILGDTLDEACRRLGLDP